MPEPLPKVDEVPDHMCPMSAHHSPQPESQRTAPDLLTELRDPTVDHAVDRTRESRVESLETGR